MKEEKIIKIRKSMNSQLKEKGLLTIVDTFMDIGILDKLDYEKWRKGQISYLEKVCKGNLHKLSETVKEIYKYSQELRLLQRHTFYKKYGKGKIKLRFSKSGQEKIGERYACTFIQNKI